jgi:hypothetical protein
MKAYKSCVSKEEGLYGIFFSCHFVFQSNKQKKSIRFVDSIAVVDVPIKRKPYLNAYPQFDSGQIEKIPIHLILFQTRERRMELSRISSAPYQPRVTRIGQRELRLIRRDKRLKHRSVTAIKFSRMLSAPDHRRVTPISQPDLQSIHGGKSLKWSNRSSYEIFVYAISSLPPSRHAH